jgi:hypothetical protein
MRPLALLTAVVAAAAILATNAASARNPWKVPVSFMEQALCVHSGWHYQAARNWPERRALHRRYGGQPEYWQGRVAFYRTTDVPDTWAGGSGEGGWPGVVGSLYGGGMSFMLGTWHRAGGKGDSVADIAAASPFEQIFRAYVIVVRQRPGHPSWGEWPQTARACGYL